MLLFNASDEEAIFTLPPNDCGRIWSLRVDTRQDRVASLADEPIATVEAGAQYSLLAHSMAVLRGRTFARTLH